MKKFAIIFLALVLTLAFAACGGNTDSASVNDSVAATSSEETSSSANDRDNDAAMPDSWFTAN